MASMPLSPAFAMTRPGKQTYYFAEVPLYKGAEILKLDLEITGPNPAVNVNVSLPLFVTFSIGGDLIRELDRLAVYVVETIREFEPSF
jgi:hypothetical protein